jgi:hypothetical protein
MMTASIRNNQLNLLARKAGYNLALRHFRTAQGFAADVGDGFNLADVLNAALYEEIIEEFQVRPVVNILLAEKFGYSCQSQNLKEKIVSADNLAKAVAGWTNIQVVLVYTDANDGVHLLNPEVPGPWEAALPLSKDECIVCYAGSLEDVRPGVLEDAVEDVFTLLYGGKVRNKAGFRGTENLKQFIEDEESEAPEEASAASLQEAVDNLSGSAAPVPAPAAPSGGSKKLTAKIAVNVTNELFHNGNVEAWKRIIESYKLKYPALDVLIWYEGERINDINALFKWGKVKHGVPIMFSVAGDNPTDISKLRKYLFEGASQRFEAFLHGAPGTILHLF